jgi:hypothetical protein
MYRGRLARFADQQRNVAARRMQSIAGHARRGTSNAAWPHANAIVTTSDRTRVRRWTNGSTGSTAA